MQGLRNRRAFGDGSRRFTEGRVSEQSGVEAAGRECAAGACPACGAPARRAAARFCSTCGRDLGSGDYFPSDALRASYHMQDRRSAPPRQRAMSSRRRPRALHQRPMPRVVSTIKNANGASTTALAFVTYSLVPYLGILFCPGAIVTGFVGLVRVRRSPQIGGARLSAAGVALGFVVLGAQIFLWWILYKVPEWATQF